MSSDNNSRRQFLKTMGVGLGGLYLNSLIPNFANASSATGDIRPVYRGQSHMVMDVTTGNMLIGNNTKGLRYPASLAKLMTASLAFDALRDGRVHADDRVVFSRRAANTENVRLFVGAGNSLSLDTALIAMCTRSSNDVALAVAEHVGGNVENFVRMMNAKAALLDMTDTRFYDPAGLNNMYQRSTAVDMLKLGRAIVLDQGAYLHYFNHPTFTYRGKTGNNVNRLVRNPNADGGHIRRRLDNVGLTPIGMKTGYINNAKHNLMALVQDENGNKILSVGFGGISQNAMAEHLANLTILGYDMLRREYNIRGDQPLPARTPTFAQQIQAAPTPR